MVIGHQHIEPGLFRRGNPLDAGNAVVHGDQQLRLALQGHRDDFRGQAVAVLEAVGHQIINMGGAEHAQPQHTDRTGGGAIGIEVADDEDALALVEISDDPRQPWTGNGVGEVGAAQGAFLAGLGIHCNERRIGLLQEHLAFGVGETAIDGVAAHHRDH